MVTQTKAKEENQRKAINRIARSLEEILIGVRDANAKLDHLVDTAKDGRYACGYDRPYDLLGETYQE